VEKPDLSEPRELENAKKLERSENGETERRGVEEDVPRDLKVAETQNLQATTCNVQLGEVLASPLCGDQWVRVSQKGLAGHQKNFVCHMLKYAVFWHNTNI